ncbi:SEP-domain-containing protein [Amylocystis lapponica]|nr:SEP-domain-containing protein [Amylocystis lapponica]
MGAHAGHAHGASDDEDDEDENQGADGGESWFAGGERSGISVQNPDRQGAVPGGDLVRDLLRRAAEAGPPPGAANGPARSSAFIGGGHTLGGEDIDSIYVPDPNAPEEPEEETAIRHLTFWREGFTVEDGDLMRYDNPEHSRILAEINSGRAPPHILNVSPGQPVELRVVKRLQDEYVPSAKARAAAFTGSGHRLGSPVPNASGAGPSGAAAASTMPGSFSISSGSASASAPAPAAERSAENISTRFEVDQTLPTTSVQIRLADGTRMVCRMNLTHTVRDIRNFINAYVRAAG